jgi:GDP-L-fucose synthase
MDNNNKERILVTGSTGLVGSALNEIVVSSNSKNIWLFLSSKDGDLTHKESVHQIFESFKPTIVVHLAANVGGLFKNMNAKLQMYEDNLLINTYVLQACVQYNVTKIITMLSTCIFPDKVEPLTVDKLHQGPPHPSNEGYAYAKRMMELHTRIIHSTRQINCINLVPTNIYGKHDNFNLADGHVLPALIHKCYLAKQEQKPFVVCGTGQPLRQFIYNKDLAKIIYECVIRSIDGHHTLLCTPPSSHELSIKSLTEKIASNMNYQEAIEWDTSYSDGQYKKTVEPSALIQSLNIPWTSINVGIEETVQWFEKNYASIRK